MELVLYVERDNPDGRDRYRHSEDALGLIM